MYYLPGGTVVYPAQPGLICPSVRPVDGPSAVTVMLLDEDCEEGEEDNDVTVEVMQELWPDEEDKDKDDGGKVEGEDGEGGVIDDEEDGGGCNDDGGGGEDDDDDDYDDDYDGSDRGGSAEVGGIAQPQGPPLRVRVKLRCHRGGKGPTV